MTIRERSKALEAVQVEVLTGCDAFENAIRKFGAVAACEWFGHSCDSDFTAEVVKELEKKP